MREVELVCPGAKHGYAIGATGTYRIRCKAKFCRRDGLTTYHIFDLATGMLRKTLHKPYVNPRELLGENQ